MSLYDSSQDCVEAVFRYVQWLQNKANALSSPPTLPEDTTHEGTETTDKGEDKHTTPTNASDFNLEHNNRLAEDISTFYNELRPKLLEQLQETASNKDKEEIVLSTKFMITHYFRKRLHELQEAQYFDSKAFSASKLLALDLELDRQIFSETFRSAFETMYGANEPRHSSSRSSADHPENVSLLANLEDEKEDLWYDGLTAKKQKDWKAIAKREAKTLFPPVTWVPEYFSWAKIKSDLKSDFVAGLTVGVMLIPQGMAYAMVAGLEPIYGLYTSFVPLIIYALFGTSRQLGVGPVAIVSLLTNSALHTLGVPEEEYPAWAFLLAFLSGVITLLFGIFRLGFVVSFLGHPVISGFTSAASIIIGFSQLKHLLGVNPQSEDYFVMEVYRMLVEVPNIHWPTLLMGSGFVAILLFLKYFKMPLKIRGRRRIIHFRKIPSAVVAVVLGVLICFFIYLGIGWDNEEENTVGGIRLLGDIPPGLPAPIWPFSGISMTWGRFGELIVLSIPIVLIGYIESYSVSKFFATKNNYEINANQEAVALGLSALVGSFFRAFPPTGGLSRTAVNASSGSKSPLSSLISATVIMITLLLLTPVFQFLPRNLLGAIIITAVVKLFDTEEMKFTWKTSKVDFLVLVLSFLCTLFIGVEIGVGVAIVLSLLIVIFLSSRPRIALLGRLPGTQLYRNARNPYWKDVGMKRTKGVIILRPDYNIYFANAEFLEKTVMENIKDADDETVYALVLDFSGVGDVDSSGLHSLKEISKSLKTRDISVYIAQHKVPVRKRMERAGLIKDDVIPKEHLFHSLHQAVKEAQADVLRRSAFTVRTEGGTPENSPSVEQSQDNNNENIDKEVTHDETMEITESNIEMESHDVS